MAEPRTSKSREKVRAHRERLRRRSQLMIDRITTVSKSKLQRRVGRLSDEDVVRLNRAVLLFLGLAGTGTK
jgi:mRNA interferase MazF